MQGRRLHRVEDDTVFHSWEGSPLKTRSIYTIFRRLVKEAKLNTHITPHSLRRSYATNNYLDGMSIRTLQRLMGHESVTVTERYLGNLGLDQEYLSKVETGHTKYLRKRKHARLSINPDFDKDAKKLLTYEEAY